MSNVRKFEAITGLWFDLVSVCAEKKKRKGKRWRERKKKEKNRLQLQSGAFPGIRNVIIIARMVPSCRRGKNLQ